MANNPGGDLRVVNLARILVFAVCGLWWLAPAPAAPTQPLNPTQTTTKTPATLETPAKSISFLAKTSEELSRLGCGACPPGAMDEGETCGSQINGGCDDASFSTTQISCNSLTCSTSWADNGFADVDWYQIHLDDLDGDSFDQLILHVESELPVIVELYEACGGPPLAAADGDGCDAAEINICLEAPKDYYVRILPGKLSTGPILFGYPCTSDLHYWLETYCSGTCGTISGCPDCQPAPEGLVAWYPFDEGANNALFADLIFGNDGVGFGNFLSGSSGKVLNAVKFAGGGVAASDLDNLDFRANEDFTIMAWVQLPVDPNGLYPIVDKRNPETLPDLGWTLTTQNGKLVMVMTDSNGMNDGWVSSQAIDDGDWHHVAATVDRDKTNGVRLYIDGVQAGNSGDATSVPGDLSTDSELLMGMSHRLDGLLNPAALEGKIDELQIFHRSLFSDEVAAIADADCGGVCKVRMHISRITTYCDSDNQSEAVVTISNATGQDRWFNLFFDGLTSDPNTTDYCIQNGPDVFTPNMTNPIHVPAFATVEVNTIIDRPSGLQINGDSACWTTTLQDTGSNFQMVRKGVVAVTEDICVDSETNGVKTIPTGIPTPVKFTVHNFKTADYLYNWKMACVVSADGQLNQLMKLQTEEPGTELFGSTVIPAGQSVDIIVDVTYLRQRTDKPERSRHSDVVIYEDPGTDVPWYTDASVGAEASDSPVELCDADVNCDGVVNITDLLAVISAWGDCDEEELCPEDINRDGTVDVTDLLAVIADWSGEGG